MPASTEPTTDAALDAPMLAPGVRLRGALQGGAYDRDQWLVERYGSFIQLTELLYRIAEHADGERNSAAIAAEVTAATRWIVTADHVDQLLAAKLAPLGIVMPRGAEIATFEPESERARSPLQLAAQTPVLGPRAIEPIARLLHPLFNNLVVLALFSAILGAHVWLFTSGDIWSGVTQMLFNPGLVLAVIAIVLASDVVHEFGHATALRHGGGRARGMGFGMYLIYPALYTDVTDAYRLGRAARVRTDLGGVYFQALFALALIVLSVVLGAPCLMVAVFLIDLEIARQFIPVVRLDGYWLLTDLLGIPDAFTEIRAALVRLARRGGRAGRLSATRLSVRAQRLLAAYALITTGVVATVIFLAARRMPDVVATAEQSLARLGEQLQLVLGNGEYILAAVVVVQMLTLAIPLAGVGFLAYTLLKLPIIVGRRRLRARRATRAAGAPAAVPGSRRRGRARGGSPKTSSAGGELPAAADSHPAWSRSKTLPACSSRRSSGPA
jgi:hypothetical protein